MKWSFMNSLPSEIDAEALREMSKAQAEIQLWLSREIDRHAREAFMTLLGYVPTNEQMQRLGQLVVMQATGWRILTYSTLTIIAYRDNRDGTWSFKTP